MLEDAKPCECQKQTLKERFRAAENTLLAALNGWDGLKVSDAEIAELRRNLIQARQACEEQGVEVETLWEFAQKRQEIDGAHVRSYADEQSRITPMLPYALRQRIAWAAGISAGVIVLLEWTTLGGMLGALAAGFVVFAVVEGILADLFPTPPIRIARMACELDVDVSDIWPKGSQEIEDYMRGYRRHERRRALRGESTGWIKAR
ncbi:MAG: hypothetical protein FD131_3316 [Rhodocyclaceae bacterium]|nr:MAG: hypothetical protein FD131_3316 [Rhodocyclaceae bacterium]